MLTKYNLIEKCFYFCKQIHFQIIVFNNVAYYKHMHMFDVAQSVHCVIYSSLLSFFSHIHTHTPTQYPLQIKHVIEKLELSCDRLSYITGG